MQKENSSTQLTMSNPNKLFSIEYNIIVLNSLDKESYYVVEIYGNYSICKRTIAV